MDGIGQAIFIKKFGLESGILSHSRSKEIAKYIAPIIAIMVIIRIHQLFRLIISVMVDPRRSI